MKVALINPKGTIFSKNKKMAGFLAESVSMGSFRHFWSAPCLGLLTIAAYLPSSWEVSYIDEIQQEIDFDADYDMVCISAMTVQADRAYEIAGLFREKQALTVIGGIHATLMPEEALQHTDVVLAGEGEALFPAFIDDFCRGKQKRLYRNSREGEFDLSNCREPRYDLIRYYDYPVINIYTTRGCPRRCSFCCASNIYGIRYRRKTNREILKEIARVQSLYPGRLLLFADDNLLILRRESKELLREMTGKNLRWIAQTDITIAEDEELLLLLRDSGCQWIVIGLESVSEKSLKSMEEQSFKAKYRKSYKEKIKMIQSFGIQVYGTFIIGLDEDEITIFDRTVEFIRDCNLYGVNITVPTPLPGTGFRRTMEAEGRILSNCWSDYTLWDVVVTPKRMSVGELEEGLYHIYSELATLGNANDRLKKLWREVKKGT